VFDQDAWRQKDSLRSDNIGSPRSSRGSLVFGKNPRCNSRLIKVSEQRFLAITVSDPVSRQQLQIFGGSLIADIDDPSPLGVSPDRVERVPFSFPIALLLSEWVTDLTRGQSDQD
jgi:hypothetical protein